VLKLDGRYLRKNKDKDFDKWVLERILQPKREEYQDTGGNSKIRGFRTVFFSTCYLGDQKKLRMRWVGNVAYTEQMGKAHKILVTKSDRKS